MTGLRWMYMMLRQHYVIRMVWNSVLCSVSLYLFCRSLFKRSLSSLFSVPIERIAMYNDERCLSHGVFHSGKSQLRVIDDVMLTPSLVNDAGVCFIVVLLHKLMREDLNFTLQVYADFPFEFFLLEENFAPFSVTSKVSVKERQREGESHSERQRDGDVRTERD